MNIAELDNPVWSALCGPHQTVAQREKDLAWYPSSIAPFAAIPSPRVVPDLASAHGAGLVEPVYFVGACPQWLPPPWRLLSTSQILQLFPSAESSRVRETAGTILGRTDRGAMRDLAQTAFPDFFRERTAELGLYLGVYEGERLIAMAGERLALEGLQEISGVCTHPEFARRGYARRLTHSLLEWHRQRGVGSFLHVSEGNAGARRLYRDMGFVERASLPLHMVGRAASEYA